jgi:hypothetical protein
MIRQTAQVLADGFRDTGSAAWPDIFMAKRIKMKVRKLGVLSKLLSEKLHYYHL